MKRLASIVLAAGKGTRMKSEVPKVLHRIAGRPILHYPLSVLKGIGVSRTVVVVGYGKDDVRREFEGGRNLVFVEQREQRGTGHAVMSALKALKGFRGDVLILSGDVPLITGATIEALIELYRRTGAVMSLITAVLDDPSGYGRVIRDDGMSVVRIVEDKDSTPEEKKVQEVNSGIYLVSSDFLSQNIRRLSAGNAQGEYYLPDLVRIAVEEGKKVSALTHLEPEEVMGVNNRVELARADCLMRRRINEAFMLSGVTIMSPESVLIEEGASIGEDTVIWPNVHIGGKTSIGRGCVLEEGVKIRDSRVKDGTVIKCYSVVEESSIGKSVSIGPFARLRPGSDIGDEARIGNFVEVKKSGIGKGTKANHLTYIGDSTIGSDVNVGAGTITCNYDGRMKHRTVIEDGAFIGSDTQLVAPVKVGKNAYVGSGTTVTKDVPPWSLVISRAPEKVVKDWVKKKGFKKAGAGKKTRAKKKGG